LPASKPGLSAGTRDASSHATRPPPRRVRTPRACRTRSSSMSTRRLCPGRQSRHARSTRSARRIR